MRKTVMILISTFTILALSGSVLAASPRELPHRYNPNSMDGKLTQLTRATDGRTWAAWAYRSGAQYDVAVTSTDENGYWSDPIFIGSNNDGDQVQPVMAGDVDGNVYLAYTDRASGRIQLATLSAGTDRWTPAIPLTEPGSGASSPALRVVRDRLVVAYRSGRGIDMIDLPLAGIDGGFSSTTINDNPDPVEYRPNPKDDGDEPEDGITTIRTDDQIYDILGSGRKRSNGGTIR
jgi:hypothetical protein